MRMRFVQLLKTMNANWLIQAILILIICFLSLWFVSLRLGKPVVRSICVSAMSTERSIDREQRVRVIEAQTVNLGIVSKRINTVGHLRANAMVMIKSELSGRIAEVLFTEGSLVKKGDLIIRFEDAEYNAAIQVAEGEFEHAKSNFERISKLYEQKTASKKQFDEESARLKIAEGKYLQAKANLEKANIRAPFDGTIGIMNISSGAFVQAGTELVSIVDNKSVKVTFKVPEKNIHDVGPGQVVEIKVSAFKEQVFSGIVEAIDAKVEQESHSMQVKGVIPNPDNLLRDGLFANVSLIIGEKGNSMTVDEASVDRIGEIEYVWVVERGRAEKRRVLTGSRENGQIEIIAGLQPGQIVVTSGQIKLSDGAKVKISNMPDPSAKIML
ncbi:MAG: efflux RND transporter periplasmic adaptor subunit [Pseudomonadota bacterium]|jgi:membrane fusion protein (multidrug efflux system)|nr:efflux RND transporter periplasmic adaptor subunit [Alphaproteobacteria bacterium]